MTARRSLLLTVLAYPGALSAQNIAEVQVAPPSVTIRIGERSGLLATAFDRAGNVIPTVRIIWSSNNVAVRSEEHTSELQSHSDLVCRLLLEKKNKDHHDGAVDTATSIADQVDSHS